ncbi:MAG: hypothetical protein ACK559_26655, partial [bacterium]
CAQGGDAWRSGLTLLCYRHSGRRLALASRRPGTQRRRDGGETPWCQESRAVSVGAPYRFALSRAAGLRVSAALRPE